jgi:hypothetical protein
MFEPMGGSAPKYTGLNVINPLATICAGGMMMDTLGEPANLADLGGNSTAGCGWFGVRSQRRYSGGVGIGT